MNLNFVSFSGLSLPGFQNFSQMDVNPFRLCDSLNILVHKNLSYFKCPSLNLLNRHCSNSNLSTAAFITAGWLGNLIHDSQQQKKLRQPVET